MSLVTIYPNDLPPNFHPLGSYCKLDEPEFAIHKEFEGRVLDIHQTIFNGECDITPVLYLDEAGNTREERVYREVRNYPVICKDAPTC